MRQKAFSPPKAGSKCWIFCTMEAIPAAEFTLETPNRTEKEEMCIRDRMQLLHHVLKFLRRTVGAGIGHFGCKIVSLFIPPVIDPGRFLFPLSLIHI